MTQLLIFAGIALGVTWGGIVFLLMSHQAERREWALERRALVDRAIARHSGEVIGLDRNSRAKVEREHEPRLIEGLN